MDVNNEFMEQMMCKWIEGMMPARKKSIGLGALVEYLADEFRKYEALLKDAHSDGKGGHYKYYGGRCDAIRDMMGWLDAGEIEDE